METIGKNIKEGRNTKSCKWIQNGSEIPVYIIKTEQLKCYGHVQRKADTDSRTCARVNTAREKEHREFAG